VDLVRGVIRVERASKEINSLAASLNGDKGLLFGDRKSDAARRIVSMPAPIRAMPADYLAQPLPSGQDADALVFTTPSGKPVRHNLFYKRFFRPRMKAALPHARHALRWHDLRHTCAALSLAVAPNLHVVKERLGHEDIRTTVNIYGHLLPAVDAALADGLAALFNGADRGGSIVPLHAAE
jgi:integrase